MGIRNYGLSFITNEDLYKHVQQTVSEYSFDINLKKFNSNLIDPIKLTFDSIVYQQTLKQTIENEVLRQLDKSNSNSIGYFHQNIFKYFGNGWIVPPKGYDVINIKEKIYCELKNKHNTMNSSSSAKTYMKMQNSIIEDPTAKCMLVEAIATKSQDIPWVITIDGKKQKNNENIRRVSIDKFYDKVTKVENSFSKLCSVLPIVIEDVVSNDEARSKQNTVYSELTTISKDIETSIYLLAFKHYESFSDFQIMKKNG